MYVDNEQAFSIAQALTATAVSTNVIDLGADRDIGKGEPMAVVINVVVAADVANANETYQFDVQTDALAAMGSPDVIASRTFTNAQAAAKLTLGARIVIPIPGDCENCLRLNYTLAGTTPSITVTAHLQPMSMIQAEATYPDAVTITG